MVMTLDDYKKFYKFGDLVVTANYDFEGLSVSYDYNLTGQWLVIPCWYFEQVDRNDQDIVNKLKISYDLYRYWIGPYQFEIVDYLFNENVFIVRLIDGKQSSK